LKAADQSVPGRLNLFQRMMLRWRDMHPYNAVHVVLVPRPFGEMPDALQHFEPRGVTILALPMRKILSVNFIERRLQLCGFEHASDQLLAVVGEARFAAHPLGIDAGLRPAHQHALGAFDLALDLVAKAFAGRQGRVEPHIEFERRELVGDHLDAIPLPAAVADKDVRHVHLPR